MSKAVFDTIKAGLEDAIAFQDGETTCGRVVARGHIQSTQPAPPIPTPAPCVPDTVA